MSSTEQALVHLFRSCSLRASSRSLVSLSFSRFTLVFSFCSCSLAPLSFEISFRSRSLVSLFFSVPLLFLFFLFSLDSLSFSCFALFLRSALVLVLFVFSRFALVLMFRSRSSFRSRSLIPLSPPVVILGSLGCILEPLGHQNGQFWLPK